MSLKSYEPVKRFMDILSSSMIIIIFLPFWLIIPILIKLDSKGPVIYRHKRVGKGGKEFYILKFRSMMDGAHEMLHEGNPELLREFKKHDWKLVNDPRITRVGKVLRSLTIDEFPQLFNVLRGDMSLVGPRAYMKQELKEQTQRYPEVENYIDPILAIKPGITGPWQVSGRNDIPFNKRAKLDATYAKNMNLIDDIKIICKTPMAMISKW